MNDDALLIRPKTFAVCGAGHVFESAQHGVVVLHDGQGRPVKQAFTCAECTFNFFASNFPAELMDKDATRGDAEWRAQELVADRRKALRDMMSAAHEAGGEAGQDQ
jgi:hypothetical protein